MFYGNSQLNLVNEKDELELAESVKKLKNEILEFEELNNMDKQNELYYRSESFLNNIIAPKTAVKDESLIKDFSQNSNNTDLEENHVLTAQNNLEDSTIADNLNDSKIDEYLKKFNHVDYMSGWNDDTNLKEDDTKIDISQKHGINKRSPTIISQNLNLPKISKNYENSEDLNYYNYIHLGDDKMINQEAISKSYDSKLPVLKTQLSSSKFAIKNEKSIINSKNKDRSEDNTNKKLPLINEKLNRNQSTLRRSSVTSITPENKRNREQFRSSMLNISSNEVTLPKIIKIDNPKKIESNYAKNTESSKNRLKETKLFFKLFD